MGMTKSQVLKEVLNHIEIREGVGKILRSMFWTIGLEMGYRNSVSLI